jgi:hypothetical protein
MKLTVSSRAPAVLNANDPWPRSGAVRNPFCCHADLLRDVADLQLEVLRDDPADFQGQIADHLALEALGLRFDAVHARWQRGDLIIAVAVGLGYALNRGGLVAHSNSCAGHDGAGWVSDRALERGGGLGKRD